MTMTKKEIIEKANEILKKYNIDEELSEEGVTPIYNEEDEVIEWAITLDRFLYLIRPFESGQVSVLQADWGLGTTAIFR